MDPNANLKEQLELAHRVLDQEGPEAPSDAYRLAELVLCLDCWLREGGYPPRVWRN